jgi:hypothetical protein
MRGATSPWIIMGEENSIGKRAVPSRRDFLAAGAGAMVSGLLASAGGAVSSVAPASSPGAASARSPAGSVPALPWSYQKLDVDVVRRRGYESYFKGSCCFAAANALLTTLREGSGGPWSTIPPEMFRYGVSGGLGWGTLCGALNACLAVLNLASSRYEELGNELIGWYTITPFPSSHHEAYAQCKNQLTTVANSPLCHVSVSTWANAAGARINDQEKKDRCGKLTGDTAAMAATLLNQALTDTLVLTYKPAREFSHCMDCHQGAKSLRDNQQGKANCVVCHDEHPRRH